MPAEQGESGDYGGSFHPLKRLPEAARWIYTIASTGSAWHAWSLRKLTDPPIKPAPLAGVSLVLMTAWSIAGEIWPVIPPWPQGSALTALVFVSTLGVHPLISITVLTRLFAPINPDPQLLAITFVFSWSLCVCVNPLSGVSLIFQGRYNIPSLTLARLNWPYVLVLYGVAVLFITGVAVFQGL